MYERPAYKTFTIPNEPKHRDIMAPSINDAVTKRPYVCPSCHNTDHPPGGPLLLRLRPGLPHEYTAQERKLNTHVAGPGATPDPVNR